MLNPTFLWKSEQIGGKIETKGVAILQFSNKKRICLLRKHRQPVWFGEHVMQNNLIPAVWFIILQMKSLRKVFHSDMQRPSVVFFSEAWDGGPGSVSVPLGHVNEEATASVSD